MIELRVERKKRKKNEGKRILGYLEKEERRRWRRTKERRRRDGSNK